MADNTALTVRDNMALADRGTTRAVAFSNMGELIEFAKIMSQSGVMVRQCFRGNVGACVAVTMVADRWGMDPFAVANKAYIAPSKSDPLGQLAYEAQLINAVVNARAPLSKKLRPLYEGVGLDRKCIINGWVKGEDDPLNYESPPIKSITPKNSPLWNSDPDQQLHYFSVRSWARRHFPEILLGIYTDDELDAFAHQGPDAARDITPARPSRQDYIEGRATAEPAKSFDDRRADALRVFDSAQTVEHLMEWYRLLDDDLVEGLENIYQEKREVLSERDGHGIGSVTEEPETTETPTTEPPAPTTPEPSATQAPAEPVQTEKPTPAPSQQPRASKTPAPSEAAPATDQKAQYLEQLRTAHHNGAIDNVWNAIKAAGAENDDDLWDAKQTRISELRKAAKT